MNAAIKNESNKKLFVCMLIGLGVLAVVLSGCNTVRGVAKDVTEAANALDPDNP
ncbi:MAG: hypothetical protein ACWA5W_05055 [Phycisphaerales bacterium]